MWVQEQRRAAADETVPTDSEDESGSSSGDDGDLQREFLQRQRDEANQQLAELEEVSNQLLKEMNVLEMQFQVERSCRESAEALAVKVTKENRVLKRRSQMLMPLIPEAPEHLQAATFDPEDTGDTVDHGEAERDDAPLLQCQAKLAELQVSLDALLAEKLQLQQQVEDLSREQVQLREQLAVELEEKEIILRKLSKQSKSVKQLKRVSQLVTEEFTEMSQKLELEQDLRQHAEVFAHQMLAEQEAAKARGVEAAVRLQLEEALRQIAQIGAALADIQRHHQEQTEQRRGDEQEEVKKEERGDHPELQDLREQLERSEEERKMLQTRLCEADGAAVQLREEVKQLQDALKEKEEKEDANEPVQEATPAAPPPPPPPPPPPSTPPVNFCDFLKSRRRDGGGAAAEAKRENPPLLDMKVKAVNEMMERIKNGIVLRPVKKVQDDDSSWKDQRSENRKSAIVELKGMLDNMKQQRLRRVPSRRGGGRHVGEAELLQVLQRRRRAMGEHQDHRALGDSQPAQQPVPAAGDAFWAGQSGGAPVLRRLQHNREKRDSRVRASALIIGNNV